MNIDSNLGDPRINSGLLDIRIGLLKLSVRLGRADARELADLRDHRRALRALWTVRARALRNAAVRGAPSPVAYGDRGDMVTAARALRSFEQDIRCKHGWTPPAGVPGVDVGLLCWARSHAGNDGRDDRVLWRAGQTSTRRTS